jgi:transcriptional regulator with XRE-family HTH domain
MSRDDWTRLGRLARERREALRLSQGAAGVSASTWRKVEHAVEPPYRRATLLAIAAALRWAPESIDLILAGGDPVELDARHGTAPTSQSIEERLDLLEDEIVRLRAQLGDRRRNGTAA